MKICQINCVYATGSTGRIVYDLHSFLCENNIESMVVYAVKNKLNNDPYTYPTSSRLLSYLSAIYRRALGRQFDGAVIQTNRIIRLLKKEKPTVVHLHCINGNSINIYRLLCYLAKHKIPTLLTLHGEFMYTGGCGHALDCEKWKFGCGSCPNIKATQSWFFDGTKHTWESLQKCYTLFDRQLFNYTAVSPWLLARAQSSPLLAPFQGSTVFNSVDTDVFRYIKDCSVEHELNINKGEKILFFATAYFEPHVTSFKGGHYIMELAQRFADKNITIVVAANYGKAQNLPSNIKFLGKVASPQRLAQLYSCADLTLIVSRKETFSMPVAESLCCGTPVVGFKAGGPETIAISDYTEFVDYGDIDQLEKLILLWIHKKRADKDYPQTIANSAKTLYGKEVLLHEYVERYKKILRKTT